MALADRSLFLYNFEVTEENSSLDFRIVPAEPIRQATLQLGFFSLGGLIDEIIRAQAAVSPVTTLFSGSADRSFNGGTENRVTLGATGGTYELLLGSGPRAGTSIAPLIGFAAADRTGSTSYQGTTTAGIALATVFPAYTFLGPEFSKKVFGNVNVSSNGTKEAVVFSIQQFFQADFRFEPKAKVIAEWQPLFDWMIQQKPFEFTPEISVPGVVLDATLEKTTGDSKGLGFTMKEQLPLFPNNYTTGMMQFRLTQS